MFSRHKPLLIADHGIVTRAVQDQTGQVVAEPCPTKDIPKLLGQFIEIAMQEDMEAMEMGFHAESGTHGVRILRRAKEGQTADGREAWYAQDCVPSSVADIPLFMQYVISQSVMERTFPMCGNLPAKRNGTRFNITFYIPTGSDLKLVWPAEIPAATAAR